MSCGELYFLLYTSASRDVPRPIAHERKYLIDYKIIYSLWVFIREQHFFLQNLFWRIPANVWSNLNCHYDKAVYACYGQIFFYIYTYRYNGFLISSKGQKVYTEKPDRYYIIRTMISRPAMASWVGLYFMELKVIR